MKKYIVIVSLFITSLAYSHEVLFLENLKRAIAIDETTFNQLREQADDSTTFCTLPSAQAIPLFTAYPLLSNYLPYIALGSLPTPIEQLTLLEEMYSIQKLFIKQDALSGAIDTNGNRLFGGNKVRKLEFLLADALRRNAHSVLTFGCFGSNHAVATATYAKILGLRCYLMLTPQPDSPTVQKNLTRMHAADAEIVFASNRAHRADNTIETFINSKKVYGDYPYFIPTGGSVALGALGFVNAAFELRNQIDNNFLPQPDVIYVAAGSFGTVAGLSLGLKAAGVISHIIAICVEPEDFPGEVKQCIERLCVQTNELLHNYDTTFPLCKNNLDNVTILHDFSGTRYGLCTQEAHDAINNAQEYENIKLDGTYTGKAFAAIIAHGQQGILKNKNVLFWNTFNDNGQ